MYPPQIADIRSALIKALPGDIDAISRLADRVQKLAPARRDLTDRCEFSQAQTMRRLLILPVKGWTDNDAHRARYALDKIAALRAEPGPRAALALACYGIERDDLPAALALLEADKPEPAPTLAPKAARKSKPKTQAAAPEADGELDAETQAALDALQREAESLSKAG